MTILVPGTTECDHAASAFDWGEDVWANIAEERPRRAIIIHKCLISLPLDSLSDFGRQAIHMDKDTE